MNWYLAKLVFQLRSAENTQTPQFEEQWRLIRADDDEWAHEKATTLGRLSESNQFNNENESNAWKFIGLKEVTQIPCMADGERIFSATEQPTNANAYIALINSKQQSACGLTDRQPNGILA